MSLNCILGWVTEGGDENAEKIKEVLDTASLDDVRQVRLMLLNAVLNVVYLQLKVISWLDGHLSGRVDSDPEAAIRAVFTGKEYQLACRGQTVNNPFRITTR